MKNLNKVLCVVILAICTNVRASSLKDAIQSIISEGYYSQFTCSIKETECNEVEGIFRDRVCNNFGETVPGGLYLNKNATRSHTKDHGWKGEAAIIIFPSKIDFKDPNTKNILRELEGKDVGKKLLNCLK